MLRFSAKRVKFLVKSGRQCGASFASDAKTTATVEQTLQSPTPIIGVDSTVGSIPKTIPKAAPSIFPNVVDIPRDLPVGTVDPNVASFDTIPGPHSLRYIAKFWTYVPLLSKEFTAGALFQVMNLGKFFGNLLSWGGNAKFFQKFFNVYGPVVRLYGPFGGDVVLLSRPEHASIVFQNEGKQPVRACLDSIEKYRLEHRNLRQAGPFLMSGPEWEKVHEMLEKPLQSSVSQHFKTIDTICNEFVERIKAVRNFQDEMPKDFYNEILKYSLECLCSMALSRRFGFLDPVGISATSDPARILEGIEGATAALRKCEFGFHVWKFMETPAWKSLVRNCDTIDSILSKYVERAQTSLKQKNDLKKGSADFSFVESLLLKEDVLVEDVMTVLLDMMLIGANSTAHSVAFLLYHLSKAPRCQKQLYTEIQKQPKELTVENLKNMPYLKACIKESLRLSPPIPILNRVLAKDAIIHRYFIPKGTYILIAAHLASIREEYFDDAKKFKPDRWLTQEVSPLAEELQVFASMPFGHGPKACQAKELAEVQIALLVCKMLKKFTVEYNYGEIESNNLMLAGPAKPLKFRFVDRV